MTNYQKLLTTHYYDNYNESGRINIISNPSSKYTPLYCLTHFRTGEFTSVHKALLNDNFEGQIEDQRRLISALRMCDIFQIGYRILSKKTNQELGIAGVRSAAKYKQSELFYNPTSPYESLKIVGSTTPVSRHEGAVFIRKRYEKREEAIPLFITCVDKQHVRYVKQCILLGKAIHPEVLKVFQNSQFDIPRGIFPSLRKAYNNHFVTPMKEMGVEIEIVDNFDEILLKYELPKARGINGYKDNLKVIGDGFLDFLKSSDQANEASGRVTVIIR